MDNRLKAYQHTGTLGKSQIDLVLQVYDGAIAAFTAAGECYEKSELEALTKLPEHFYISKDQTVIHGNVKVLRKLREGWAGIKKQAVSPQSASPEGADTVVTKNHISTSG